MNRARRAELKRPSATLSQWCKGRSASPPHGPPDSRCTPWCVPLNSAIPARPGWPFYSAAVAICRLRSKSPRPTASASISEATKAILQFCEQFEEAGQRTGMFMAEIKKAGLLMDGEVAIQPEGTDQPFIYRGFQMVDEEKLRDMRGDELRKMNQNGLLPLIFAHLFSLSQAREIFARQVEQGKGPAAQANSTPQPVEA